MQIEIQVKDYIGVEAKKQKATVSELEIAQKIEQDLASFNTLKDIENAPLQSGLIAVFDFVGRVDGKEFEGGKAENYSLEIGSGMFIPGFEDQMIGMNVGDERVLKLKFPENYEPSLAGKDCEFTVKLHKIQQKVTPALTDETVVSMGIKDISTVAEYKELVSKSILYEKEKYYNNVAIDSIYDKIFASNPFDIPKEMVDVSVAKEIDRAKEQANAYNIPFEIFLKYQGIDSEEEFAKQIYSGVENLMRRDIILTAIAKKENIQVTDEEIENYYNMFAQHQNVSADQIKEQFSKEYLASKILLFKAEDFIVSNAKIEIVE